MDHGDYELKYKRVWPHISSLTAKNTSIRTMKFSEMLISRKRKNIVPKKGNIFYLKAQ